MWAVRWIGVGADDQIRSKGMCVRRVWVDMYSFTPHPQPSSYKGKVRTMLIRSVTDPSREMLGGCGVFRMVVRCVLWLAAACLRTPTAASGRPGWVKLVTTCS